MTRNDQLKFCKCCLNRSFNPQLGIVCKLTNGMADFESSCKHFDRDFNIIVDIEKDDFKHPPKAAINKEKVPEKISINDIGLITALSIFSVIIIRIFHYASYHPEKSFFMGVFSLAVLGCITVGLLLRTQQNPQRIRFFGDIKFRLLFALSFALIHSLYTLILYWEEKPNILIIPTLIILCFVVSFFASFISVLLAKPLGFLYFKLRKRKTV